MSAAIMTPNEKLQSSCDLRQSTVECWMPLPGSIVCGMAMLRFGDLNCNMAIPNAVKTRFREFSKPNAI